MMVCRLSRLFPIVLAVLFMHADGASSQTSYSEREINEFKRQAYSIPEGTPESLSAWKFILEADPTSLEAHVMYGWGLVRIGQMEMGAPLLEATFDPTKMKDGQTINFEFAQSMIIAATIGRYKTEVKEYESSKKFTELALKLSLKHLPEGSEHPIQRGIYTEDGDICIQMQLASMLSFFPNSTQAADESAALMSHYADRLLSQSGWWEIDDEYVSAFPGGESDPYQHCLKGPFYLSFYYREDVAAMASKFYQMAIRGWPSLDRTANFVQDYDRTANFMKEYYGGNDQHKCINRKIRLAVISGVLTEGHSNSESFGGALSRLDRNIFDVTYVLLNEQKVVPIAQFTKTHEDDRVVIFDKEAGDTKDGTWTNRLAKTIESWELDIIFYFELTMSSWTRRLGMQRLAPVQANSIGHPITSGIPSSIVQYYISWGAAELPPEEAQTHYTETLKLLPNDIIYQYYERRVLPGEVSRMDGQSFGDLSRSDFGLPDYRRLYLCMQKPFKLMPEFDTLVCGIMQRDVDGIVVLHKENNASNQQIFEERLAGAGCDLSRITFLDQQPHHRLLALYREATVVLDSYPAGGDTTTREVLEMGKPLVTLPARLLGGRWSLGYMNNIGLRDATKKALIASDTFEYINLAVQIANDDNLRQFIEADILRSVPNLFRRDEAVTAWQNMFLEISPYQQCSQNGEREEL